MTDAVKGTREEVRKFGILMAVVLTLIGLFLLYKEVTFWYVLPALGGVLLIGGYTGYPVVRPVYLAWMKFAFVLGWINTRLLLGLFFYLILTPIGLMMRLFGKDFLDEKIERDRASYWTKREKVPLDQSRYERLF